MCFVLSSSSSLSLSFPSQSNREFHLSQLQYKTTTECPYLVSVAFRRVYLYHSRSSAGDGRALFALFLEGATEAFIC